MLQKIRPLFSEKIEEVHNLNNIFKVSYLSFVFALEAGSEPGIALLLSRKFYFYLISV
jgi:hypothetical protein